MSVFFKGINKKMIMFDLNGTLINEKASNKAAFIETLSQFTGRWSAADKNRKADNIYQQYEKEYRRRRRQNPSLSLSKLRFLALKKSLRSFPISTDQQFANSYFRLVAEQKKEVFQLYAEVIPVLEKLASQYELGIVSNSSGYNIEKSPLADYFTDQKIVTPDKTGHRKPDPQIYFEALKRWKVQASECVMVGNSWKNDIVSASKAGIDGIWIRKQQKIKLAYRKINKTKVIAIRSLCQMVDLL